MRHFWFIFKKIAFEMTSSLMMWMPSLFVRRLYLSFFLKSFGKHNYIGRNVDIRMPNNISIGDHCVINKNVVLDGRGELVIGNNVDIAQDSMIWTEQHDQNDDNHYTVVKPVIIKDYVWIASRATILPGVTLQKGCVIATGAVVTKDVSEMNVVAGVPAKTISIRKNKLSYQLNFHPKFRI